MEKNKKRSLKILCIMLAMLISVSTQTLAATLSTVTGLTANVVGEKAYLTWNAVSGVTGYEVYVNIAGNGYRYLGSCRTNRVTVAGFQKNTDYTIKVRAYRSVSGKKEYSPNYSNEVNIRLSASTSVPAPTPTETTLETVKNLTSTVKGTKAYLTWGKVTNASGYEIYVKIPNMDYRCLGNVSGNSATIQGFQEGSTYYVKVMAFRYKNGVKEYAKNYSNEVTIRVSGKTEETPTNPTTPTGPAKVTGLTAKVSGTTATLNWNKVSGADGYEISMATPYGTTTMYTTSNSKRISGITNNNFSYITKVRAYQYDKNKQKVFGDYSNSINVYRGR